MRCGCSPFSLVFFVPSTMELQLSAAQRVPSDALGLIFDFIEYGRRLKDGWEKLESEKGGRRYRVASFGLHKFATHGELSLCHISTRTPRPFLTPSSMQPIQNQNSSTQISLWQLLPDKAYQFVPHTSCLSLDHIASGASIRLLNTGVPPTVAFPNASELKLSFYSSNDFDRADYSVQAAAFTERICQLFPKAHDVSFIVCSWLWNGSEDVWRSLMHSIVPTPRTLICYKLLNESTTLRDGISNGVRRLYLGHKRRYRTTTQLFIRIGALSRSLYFGLLWTIRTLLIGGTCLSTRIHYSATNIPKLARLSIETRGDARKLFTRSATNRFPSLTSLSLLTFCEVDIGSLVGDRGETLTSLTMYLTESLVQSLRGRLFPSLACVRHFGEHTACIYCQRQ
ncbi:hypothetical protein DL89DRAFT_183339 [Linderina pennispora]|uniref:Uncharacterized protein n=1 Tax=Linderina pennispora TaxID=61395 RepID=A0A1Y1W5S9_9FUNG|nr:uncharacterized protein DL89DRAFT_183339 [Linderina pennispora]ORX68752.1 hypothetical protein DL89DRAFT_183339 [Linderina pennispora]